MQETQNELNLLKQLLKNLGFHILTDPDSSFTVYIDHHGIGSCNIYHFDDGEETVSVLLILSRIPEEIINQLLLLGFEIESSREWIKYRVTIREGTTNAISTESTRRN